MRRKILCVAAVALVASVASVEADTTTWDAYAGFHTTDNSASQTWQYMETTTVGVNGSYTLLPTYGTTAYHGVGWNGAAGSQTDVTGVTDGTIKVSPYWNSPNSPRAPVIAWKSPGAGTVNVSFAVQELSGVSDSTTIPRDGLDIHLFQQGNPTELAGGYLPGAGSIPLTTITGLSVTPGQMLYLQAGPGTVNHWYDWAAVQFTVTGDVSVPEPSTLVMLTCGVLSLLAYAWRKRK